MDKMSTLVLAAATATVAVVILAATTSSVAAVPIGDQIRMQPKTSQVVQKSAVQSEISSSIEIREEAAITRAAAISPYYIVRFGDTLSSIAARTLGSAARWPALWWVNRKIVPNPDLIEHGQELVEPPASLGGPAILRAAMAAIPKAAIRLIDRVTSPNPSSPGVTGSVDIASWSGYKQCVAMHESADGRDLQNAYSTASGWFGFLDTTWEDVTGLPGPARDYSLATQSAAFDKLYAASGRSPWITDGC